MSGWRVVLDAARAEHVFFDRARATPRASQATLLRQILAHNAGTDFGRAHGFADIHTIDDFRARVPIRPYERYARGSTGVASGETGVLTSEAVIAFEETGGSTAGGKLIPSYGVEPQGVSRCRSALARRSRSPPPGAFAGKVYVSISPEREPHA